MAERRVVPEWGAPLLLAGLVLMTGGCTRGPALPEAAELTRHPITRGANWVGEERVVTARHQDTFVTLARAHGLGYEELATANPGLDPWFPGAGAQVLLPGRFQLPGGPRKGIVLNVATRRLFYYPPRRRGQPREVVTYPVAVGIGPAATPTGNTRVISKRVNPTWVVPDSIRAELRAAGLPAPTAVPPGPDNPLGSRALRLGFESILIHGTNQPGSIGMAVSHGCVRLYPEDIEELYDLVPVGTPVRIVDEPALVPPGERVADSATGGESP